MSNTMFSFPYSDETEKTVLLPSMEENSEELLAVINELKLFQHSVTIGKETIIYDISPALSSLLLNTGEFSELNATRQLDHTFSQRGILAGLYDRIHEVLDARKREYELTFARYSNEAEELIINDRKAKSTKELASTAMTVTNTQLRNQILISHPDIQNLEAEISNHQRYLSVIDKISKILQDRGFVINNQLNVYKKL